ncbi:hypothetical protein [Psychromonas sp. MME2]|uniref:hypothetical protein n=1 Tax=unclassified Psychromonas TaxID=2614957 RepID=UPI00339CA758
MNDLKSVNIQDTRPFFQRILGYFLLDECPKCHYMAYAPPSYGYQGHCKVCDYSEPIVPIKDRR